MDAEQMALLARIDERTKLTATAVDSLNSGMKTLEDKLSNTYVTKTEFEPVKRAVYGFIALIIGSLISAIIYLVLRKP